MPYENRQKYLRLHAPTAASQLHHCGLGVTKKPPPKQGLKRLRKGWILDRLDAETLDLVAMKVVQQQKLLTAVTEAPSITNTRRATQSFS